LTERRSGAAGEQILVEHADQFVMRLPSGGFALRQADQPELRAIPDGGAWHLTGQEAVCGWSLQRSLGAAGFSLSRSAGGPVAGWTMPLVGTAAEGGLRFVLLDDGRLFRIVRRGPREGGFDLLGWETPGAYLEALPQPEGWLLRATPACAGLRDVRALSLLLAAEVLDAEEPLRGDAT
jgi:hypothetical protein